MQNNYLLSLKDRIKDLRSDKNLTQSQLANTLGITEKAVSKWESGKGYPDISILPDLAEALDCSIDYLLTGSEKTEYKIISSIEYAAKTGDKSKLDIAVKLSIKDDKGIAFIQYIDKYNRFEFFEEEINKIKNDELDVIREYLTPRILEWLIVLHRELDVFTSNRLNFYKRGTIRNRLSFNDGRIGEIKFPVDKTLYDNSIHRNSIATYKDLFKLLIIHFDDLDESQKKDYFGLSCTDFVKPENCWASAYPYFLHYAYMLNKKAFDILIKRVASIEEYKKEEERIKLDQSYNYYSRMNTLKKFKGGRPLEKTLDLAIKQNDTKYIKILNQYFNFDDFEIRKRAINQDESLTPDEKLYETIFRNGVVDLNSITKFSYIKYAIKALQQGYLTEYEMVSDKLAHKQFKEIYKFLSIKIWLNVLIFWLEKNMTKFCHHF